MEVKRLANLIPVSQALIDDANAMLGLPTGTSAQIQHAVFEFELLGIISDTLWDFHKTQDTELRKRLEEHAAYFGVEVHQ